MRSALFSPAPMEESKPLADIPVMEPGLQNVADKRVDQENSAEDGTLLKAGSVEGR